MTRPTLEVADILRAQGDRFLDRYRSSFDFQQLKALRAIQRCRTAALGGHRDACLRCGYQAISYNSCRNRHCPKCQAQARERWLAARERELLATSYFHVVFTVPHELNVLALENPRLFYDLLFAASAQTLLEIAADPKHLGAEIGLISILHTWGQNLLLHPHIHCAIPAGGLSPHHRRWIRPRYPFFLSVKVLSRVFRGKFLAGLKRLHRRNKLHCAGPAAALSNLRQFAQLIRRLHRHDWVVYAKPAFGGPMQVLRYLGRYTHRVAISNHRFVGLRPGTHHVPLEGLCSRWQTKHDDAFCHGVLASLLPPRAPQRVRTHPSLRVFCQSRSRFPLGLVPATAGVQFLCARKSRNVQKSPREFDPLALPALRRGHDRGSAIYGCGIISMHLLRFFVALLSLAELGCAPARRCIRVLTSLDKPLSQFSAHTLARSCGPRRPSRQAFTSLRWSAMCLLATKLAFKSHSSPRPPQTPAASS